MGVKVYGGGGSSSSTGTTISDKTATQMYALVGTEGQIIYNTTYKHHFVYRNNWWGPLGAPDPRYGFYLTDEFSGAVTTGELGWTNVNGTATTASQTMNGAMLLRTATASTRALLASTTNSVFTGTMDVYAEWICQFPTLATAGEDYSALMGIGDAGAYVSGSLGVDNASLVYNRGVNGANLIQTTTSNSVSTSTNTTTAVVAATNYCFGVLVKAGTSAEFFVNRVSTGATHTTNLPTGRGTQFQLRLDKIAGTGNSDIIVDTFTAWGFYNGSRV